MALRSKEYTYAVSLPVNFTYDQDELDHYKVMQIELLAKYNSDWEGDLFEMTGSIESAKGSIRVTRKKGKKKT